MTLHEAIAFLLDEFHLEDKVYDAREMSYGMEPLDIESSWDHPFVKKFSDSIQELKMALIPPSPPFVSGRSVK